MVGDNFSLKHILGLKIKDLRTERDISFQELSAATGLSVSYLSEIEKGKKYPKGDKIIALAEALEVTYDYLVSLKVSRRLEPVIDLLNSDIFKEFPLEAFGLDPQKVVELISVSPDKINAFITTIGLIARNYEMGQEHFYFAALRSYQEMHDNYFPELEKEVKAFQREYKDLLKVPVTANALKDILKNHFGIEVDRSVLHNKEELRDLRSYYNDGQKKLLLNTGLTSEQETFLIGREIGFQLLKLQQRPKETPPQKGYNFEVTLNNYKASYFSAALIIPEKDMVDDVKRTAASNKWDENVIFGFIKKYRSTPEMLMQRLTNILPKHFGIKNLFFLRFVGTDDFSSYHLTKELHLTRAHSPHANSLNESYCRRWISLRVIKQLRAATKFGKNPKLITGAQISKYHGTSDEYLCLSMAFPNVSNEAESISLTIGFYIDNDLKKRIKFTEDEGIKSRIVSTTCERCSWADCEDRIAPPLIVQREENKRRIEHALDELEK